MVLLLNIGMQVKLHVLSYSQQRRGRGTCIPCLVQLRPPMPLCRDASTPQPGQCELHCWQLCRHEAVSSHDSGLRLAAVMGDR